MTIESLLKDCKVSEIELSFKPCIRASELPIIKSAEDAYTIFLNKWDDNKIEFVEQFYALLLNRANRVIGICQITSGGISHTIMDFRILFSAALRTVATGVIVAHNHPSGTLQPSQPDIQVTHAIRDAGKMLNIELIDHLIVTRHGYYSFKEEGAL
jgi:DNA repair protein RadC